MAEDQGINGNRWTDEASRLLKKCGWTKIADSNIDVVGTNGLKHGIDAIFSYKDGFNPGIEQCVFIEAKRYSVNSFSKTKLSDWIMKLDDKIRNLQHSSEFINRYPSLLNLKLNTGVLAIWFHDLDQNLAFKEVFNKNLIEIVPPKSRGLKSPIIRLFILDNDKILRVASMIKTIEQLKKEFADSKLDFYYPASARLGNSVQQLPVINLEYIFSQFVLTKFTHKNNNDIVVEDVVFYFGELDMNSFNMLNDALLLYDMINGNNDLIIYKYLRQTDEYRKIEPDVISLFKSKSVTIKDMDRFSELPAFILKD